MSSDHRTSLRGRFAAPGAAASALPRAGSLRACTTRSPFRTSTNGTARGLCSDGLTLSPRHSLTAAAPTATAAAAAAAGVAAGAAAGAGAGRARVGPPPRAVAAAHSPKAAAVVAAGDIGAEIAEGITTVGSFLPRQRWASRGPLRLCREASSSSSRWRARRRSHPQGARPTSPTAPPLHRPRRSRYCQPPPPQPRRRRRWRRR